MTTHNPLVVRAQLAHGISLDPLYPVSLDGLLAAVVWGIHKSRLRATGTPTVPLIEQTYPPDLDLPLSICGDRTSGEWHWAATCAHAVDHPTPDPEIRHHTGYLDTRHLDATVNRQPVSIPPYKGRYRERRLPTIITLTSAVTWRAHGDIDRVAELLATVDAIGKKRAYGEGRVLKWTVVPDPDPDADEFSAGHLHIDGSWGRPAPRHCLERARPGTRHGGTSHGGLRPPYLHPSRRHPIVCPV
ncbi:hypothetical protein GS504_01765 [Rhodococcus hoagii]|nr:hypothetical protein [Prescottella equi]